MPQVKTTPAGLFNAVNEVESLYGDVDTTWTLPSTGTSTTCWIARHDDVDNSDWNSICSTSSGVHVRDQQSVDTVTPMINANTANWVHSRYHWNEVLNRDDMMIVTRALRKEIGGKPFLEQSAVVPISDLRAYHLRFLIALRPPQSINIFADYSDNIVPDRMGNGFDVTIMEGSVDLVEYTIPSNGADNDITALSGDTDTMLLWPENSIPTIMTVCSVSRYTEEYAIESILQCRNSPTQSGIWYHGHIHGGRGIAFYGKGWKTLYDDDGFVNDWLIMCGSSSRVSPGNIVIDQMNVGLNNSTNIACRLNVNYENSQYLRSFFEIHSLYIWNAELSNAQMKDVTSALRAQIGGGPDIANDEKGDPVDPMVPSLTAYEQACPVEYNRNDNTGDCIPSGHTTSTTPEPTTTTSTTPGPTTTTSTTPGPTTTTSTTPEPTTTTSTTPGPTTTTSTTPEPTTTTSTTPEPTTTTSTTPGPTTTIPCPRGTTSQIGAETKDDCLCIPGWFRDDGICVPCPMGSYKLGLGDGVCTNCSDV
jgi:hypothetical protein